MESKKTSLLKIDTLIKKADSLMRSELWAALLLIYQGGLFLFFTEMAFTGAAFGIVIPVGLLAAGVLLDCIFNKKLLLKENRKTVIMALIFGILAILVMLHPKKLSAVFHYVTAVMLIADGIIVILDLAHYTQLREKITELKQKKAARIEASATREYQEAILTGISDQRSFMLKPLEIASGRTGDDRRKVLVLGIIGIAMGIALLFFRMKVGTQLVKVSGVFLLIIGIKNLILAWRAAKRLKNDQ